MEATEQVEDSDVRDIMEPMETMAHPEKMAHTDNMLKILILLCNLLRQTLIFLSCHTIICFI